MEEWKEGREERKVVRRRVDRGNKRVRYKYNRREEGRRKRGKEKCKYRNCNKMPL